MDASVVMDVVADLPPSLLENCELVKDYIAAKLLPMLIELSPALGEVLSSCDAVTGAIDVASCTARLTAYARLVLEELLDATGLGKVLDSICWAYRQIPAPIRYLLSEGIYTVKELANGNFGAAAAHVVNLVNSVGRSLLSSAAKLLSGAGAIAKDLGAKGLFYLEAILPKLPGSSKLFDFLRAQNANFFDSLEKLEHMAVTMASGVLNGTYGIMAGVLSGDPDAIVAGAKSFVEGITGGASAGIDAGVEGLQSLGSSLLDAFDW